MMENIQLLYYSPTGTTQKIIREIAKNTGLEIVSENNIAEMKPESLMKIDSNSLTIIGLPVYAGRLPAITIDALKKLQSNQSPLVIVVVYGNRDFEDALLELKDITQNCGFHVIAGAAFIGEHSYSTTEQPIAPNRPDLQDLEKCKTFAHLIMEKFSPDLSLKSLSMPDIPGNFPYKERVKLSVAICPETDNEGCNLCGVCVDVCPTKAISIRDMVITDAELCTLCCACVKSCPEKVRTFDHPTINAIRERLFLNFSTRKEPIYFV